MIPLVFLAVSSVLNIVLDLWFVVGLNKAVAGAAQATVIAQYISGVGIAVYTWVRFPQMRSVARPRTLRAQRIPGNILLFLADLCPAIGDELGILMVQGLVNSFGPVVMAAFAAA